MRRPDTSSPEVMTRRAWWLVVLNLLIPGSAQVLAGNRKLGRVGLAATLTMWALVVVSLLVWALWRTLFLMVATHGVTLLIAQVLLVAYAVLWTVLTLDTLRLVRLVKARPRARLPIAALSIVGLVLAGGGAVYASQITGTTRDTLGAIFGATGPTVPPSDGYYNILLLGADSGEGRDSMRFDSISVVSVNADTGAVTITGIPRDMPHFRLEHRTFRQQSVMLIHGCNLFPLCSKYVGEMRDRRSRHLVPQRRTHRAVQLCAAGKVPAVHALLARAAGARCFAQHPQRQIHRLFAQQPAHGPAHTHARQDTPGSARGSMIHQHRTLAEAQVLALGIVLAERQEPRIDHLDVLSPDGKRRTGIVDFLDEGIDLRIAHLQERRVITIDPAVHAHQRASPPGDHEQMAIAA